MTHENKQVEEDEAPGAPEWMVTFSDCMTLLLTFFVLLLSFSSFDERIFKKLQMILREDLPKITKLEKRSKDSIISPDQTTRKYKGMRPKSAIKCSAGAV